MPASKAGFEFGARMTVVRLPDGGLWIHSPIELAPLQSEIDALGKVRFIVSPFRFHYEHLAQWAAAFPEARVWSAPGLNSETAKTRIHDFLEDAPPEQWSSVLDQAIFGGNKLVNEVDFFHKPSRTLLLADLCFNIPRSRPFLTRIIARFLGVMNKVAPSRTFRAAIADKEECRASVRRILEWDFDRIVLSHGDMVERGGKARFRQAFAWLFEK